MSTEFQSAFETEIYDLWEDGGGHLIFPGILPYCIVTVFEQRNRALYASIKNLAEQHLAEQRAAGGPDYLALQPEDESHDPRTMMFHIRLYPAPGGAEFLIGKNKVQAGEPDPVVLAAIHEAISRRDGASSHSIGAEFQRVQTEAALEASTTALASTERERNILAADLGEWLFPSNRPQYTPADIQFYFGLGSADTAERVVQQIQKNLEKKPGQRRTLNEKQMRRAQNWARGNTTEGRAGFPNAPRNKCGGFAELPPLEKEDL